MNCDAVVPQPQIVLRTISRNMSPDPAAGEPRRTHTPAPARYPSRAVRSRCAPRSVSRAPSSSGGIFAPPKL